VTTSAPTLRTAIAAEVSIDDRVLHKLDAQPQIFTRVAELFVTLKRRIVRDLQTLLTFDAKRMIAQRKAGTTDPIAQQRAKTLDAIDKHINEGRLSVRDVDEVIAAARQGMLSTGEVMAKLRNERNKGRDVSAFDIVQDSYDAMAYSMGALAPKTEAKQLSALVKKYDASKTKLYLTDLHGNDHLIGDLKDISFNPKPIDLGSTNHLTMRCSACGGQARLVDGEFGLAGASYRCDSCGIKLADCEHCRAIYARRENQECPRCETRARKER
jgi:hypothetical protein